MDEPIPVRKRCYQCFRPQRFCFCDRIPAVDNATNVLILQHPKERKHAFNTARIVHRALANVRVISDYPDSLADMDLPLSEDAALLYPGAGSVELQSLSPSQRPRQLVVIDGTWHHAKTMIRDIPALKRLPRVGLQPLIPGRYRIRREPTDFSLSTLEAVALALSELEPDTAGMDQLVKAFDAMIERQLDHPNMRNHWRKNSRRRRDSGNVPRALLQSSDNLVVAYGESSRGQSGNEEPRLVYWVAERIGSGETFARLIAQETPISASQLAHFKLGVNDFEHARPAAEVRAAWQAFLRPNDTIAVYHHGMAKLAPDAVGGTHRYVVLKSVRLPNDMPDRTNSSLESTMRDLKIQASAAKCDGRAGQRLAAALAYVQHLRTIAR